MNAEASRRQVLHLTGRDTPGAVSDICALLAECEARLIHLGQSSVHGCLTLNVEIEGGQSDTLGKAREFAAERRLVLEITELPSTTSRELGCSVWVTILGDVSDGLTISGICQILREENLAIRRVDSIGRRDLMGVNILANKTSVSNAELRAIRRKLLARGQELNVDLAVQRDDVYRTSKRLLCMDVDSTFVKGEFIDELADLAGVKAQVADITARAMRGELDFEASLRARVALLKGLPMSRARELCDHFELSPGADDLVRTVKRLGMRVGLVSGGFDFFVEQLKERFGLDFTFANELEVENELLTGKVIGNVVDSARKAQVLKDMSHVFGIRPEQTIAVGDGANDIEMIQAAGLGIAYQAKARLQEVADARFNQHDRLDTLLYLMGYDAELIVGACK